MNETQELYDIEQLIKENKQLRKFIKTFDQMCDNALYNLKQQTDSHIRRDTIIGTFANMHSMTQAILKQYLGED